MSTQQLLARLIDELPAPGLVEPFAFLEDTRLPPRITLVEPTAFASPASGPPGGPMGYRIA